SSNKTFEILSATQLFLNREIWGINTTLLSRSHEGRLGIVTQSVEATFRAALPSYLRFMKEKLGVPPPYRVEGGRSGVTGRAIVMPSNYFNDEWGPIHEQNVTWSGILQTAEKRDVDSALLNIFEAFFDAAGVTRPARLYDFPPAVETG